jgi:hypothetical protein
MPRKKIHLTGKGSVDAQPLTAAQAKQIVADGKNRTSAFYATLTLDQVVGRLSSWSPTLREDAATVLAERDSGADVIHTLIKLLDSPDLTTRYGACQALAKFGERAAPAVPALRKAMNADDTWLRVLAARALGEIHEPARVALTDMLKRIAQNPAANDPRGIEQRFASVVVFKSMLNNSIEGIDRDLLRHVIVAGLKNEHGEARDSVSRMYELMTFDEIEPLLPAIRDAIVHRPPSGPEVARVSGLAVLAKYHYKEGIPLCVAVLDPDRHGAYWRVPKTLNILTLYGAAAKPMIPELQKMVDAMPKNRTTQAALIQEAIKTIEKSTVSPPLRSLE